MLQLTLRSGLFSLIMACASSELYTNKIKFEMNDIHTLKTTCSCLQNSGPVCSFLNK